MTCDDIKALIEQAEKLKRDVEELKKKSFLTEEQSKTISDRKRGVDIALYLLRLSYINREECENNFGIVESYFTPTESLKSGRFAQNLGSRNEEEPGLIEWYNPNKHKGFFVRYDFNEKKFRQYLNQYTAKQRQLYWKKHIQPLIIQLDTDLTPWLPFMKPYIDTEAIQNAIETAEPETLSNAIYGFKKIQKVIETKARQEPASGTPAPEPHTEQNGSIAPAAEKAYQSYNYAIEKNPELAGKHDKDVHSWLKENGTVEYELPALDTWKRQVRVGRKEYGTQKNTPRGGRTSLSVKSYSNIELSEMTNQFTKEK